MSLLSIVVLILVLGVIFWAAEKSGIVSPPFLDIAKKVAIVGLLILLIYLLLVWTGTLGTLRDTRIGG